MKFFYYLRLFFFIAFNWNIRLAWFTVYHEIRGEKKYDSNTSKIEDPRKLTVASENVTHSELYQGANYFLLEKVFAYLQGTGVNENITDLGCGKGRVLIVAAHYGFKKITGVEFVQELCETARMNIIAVQEKFPKTEFKITCEDAATYTIEKDAQVFFFFNPFDEVIMLAVAKNILLSVKQNPREVFVVYINPVHKEIFMSAGFEQVFYFEKLKYIQATILMKSPEDFPGLNE